MGDKEGSSDEQTTNYKPEYTILLPTYKEVENLPYIIYLINKTFEKSKFDHEIIVIDDGSDDGTQEACKDLMKIYNTAEKDIIRLKPRAKKLGLGTAYVHGMTFARGNFIILMDADMSHHPKFIPKMIELQKSGGYDIITGTRYVTGGGVYGWDTRRKLTSRVANYLADTSLNLGVSDLTGSFRLYKKEILQSCVRDVKSKGYVFQMEMMFRAREKGYKVGEVPITFVDRQFGSSKLGTSEIYQYAQGLVSFFCEQQK